MLNDNQKLTDQILVFLKKHPEGVAQEKVTSEIPFKEAEIVEVLNNLLESNRIYLIENQNETLLKYRTEKEALKFRDLTKEELSVHELILQSGSKGISTTDLKIKMHIDSSTFINRILKTLEKKYLVKSLKVLNTKNKKVWIGFDIEPSQEVTGGVWCSNQEYDHNLVEVFKEKCLQYISQQNIVSRQEVLLYAKCANLMQRELKEDDIQKILNILIFDGKIEPIFPEVSNIETSNKYSLLISKNESLLELIKYTKTKEYKSKAIFDCIPCTHCPVFNECKTTNIVNPTNCPHMKKFVES